MATKNHCYAVTYVDPLFSYSSHCMILRENLSVEMMLGNHSIYTGTIQLATDRKVLNENMSPLHEHK